MEALLTLVVLALCVWGYMRFMRPDAHDPMHGVVVMPDISPDITSDIPHSASAIHAASSQRSVAKALEIYQSHELERRLAQSPPEPSIALQVTMQARNLGAILRALRD